MSLPVQNARMLRHASCCFSKAPLWLVVTTFVLASCGLNVGDAITATNDGAVNTEAGSASDTSSGVNPSFTLASLTTEQASVLCDWTNTKQGGYGRQVACSDGTSKATNATNLACVNRTRSIGNACATLTVGDIENCTNAVGTDLCKVTSASGCAAVQSCGQ